MAPTIPPNVQRWFWEVDPETIELPMHSDYVLERLMQRGDWDAMRWVLANFASSVLRDFLIRKGSCLAPRERAYWALVSGAVAVASGGDGGNECGGGRPSWADK
jgi:hypothetical protein